MTKLDGLLKRKGEKEMQRNVLSAMYEKCPYMNICEMQYGGGCNGSKNAMANCDILERYVIQSEQTDGE